MSTGTPESERIERVLARVLNSGTWVACVVIAAGLLLSLVPAWKLSPTGSQVVTAGITLLILLPVLRVVLMLLLFLKERDYHFAAIAALVLAILFAGFVIGTLSR